MPLKQHPVPQNISSYEFRLVGDMTLKQFGYLAGGTVLALIFYGLPIPDFIKWPFILLFAFLGFAFAFLPFEERPLLLWITAFIKSVSSPTLFIWRKQAEPIAIFTHQPPVLPKATITPSKFQVENYLIDLATLPSAAPPVDASEKKFLDNIHQLFQSTPAAAIQSVTSAPLQPRPAPRPIPPLPLPPVPVISPFAPLSRNPQRQIKNFKTPVRIINQPIQPNENAVFRILPAKPVAAETSTELPFPEPPRQPNILVGMVLNQAEQIVEGAILEIRNEQGLPVRAFKTNKLGQFMIATPLSNGEYEIEIEKEDLNFDIIKIKAEGKIIQPIKIKAK